MRALIRWLDFAVRRASGVFEFCNDPNCLLRLQWAWASHDVSLSDGTEVRAGDRVLILHLWNEHVPRMGAFGPDLAWAVRVRRMFLEALGTVAGWLTQQGDLGDVRAVGGMTGLILLAGDGSEHRLMRGLGFDVFPWRSPLGWFGEFWENLYAWALMWAFNPASLQHRSLPRLRRTEMWISTEEFIRRYGGTVAPRRDGLTSTANGL